jgi:hypothetical protein
MARADTVIDAAGYIFEPPDPSPRGASNGSPE